MLNYLPIVTQFVTFLGWLSDPFKGLSDLQLGDEKGTLNHLVFHFSWREAVLNLHDIPCEELGRSYPPHLETKGLVRDFQAKRCNVSCHPRDERLIPGLVGGRSTQDIHLKYSKIQNHLEQHGTTSTSHIFVGIVFGLGVSIIFLTHAIHVRYIFTYSYIYHKKNSRMIKCRQM